MNLQQQTKNVAAQGRYGDTMLMHVNPAEVAGLAQAMPLTINPETGQPEAFLPFLLPLLGSLGGTALAGGTLATTLGLGGLSGAALGAIGSGLGTWAATGDIKKGILGGLTGYGVGKVLGAGMTAAKGAQAAATIPAATGSVGINAANMTADEIARNLGSQVGTAGAAGAAGQSAIQGGTQFVANQALSSAGAGAGAGAAGAGAGSGLSAGLSAAGKQLMQPSSYIPLGVGMGGLGTMQSQEQFQQAMANLAANDTEEYNRILAEHPEYVPMLQGNQTFAEGGAAKLKKEYKPTAAIGARDIDPYFMAGLQGERGYLQNVNPSSGQIISGKSGYDFGTEMANEPMSAPFNPTQTVGYQSFYNAPREPYVLDPYAKQTFEAPPPPSAPPPRIVEPVTEEPQPPVATLPVPPPEESTIVTPTGTANPYNIPDDMSADIGSIESKYGITAEDLLEMNNSKANPYTFDLSTFNPSSYNPPSYNPSIFDPSTAGLSQEEIESGSFDPSMFETPPTMVIPEEVIEPAFQPFGGRGGSNNPFDIPSDDVFEDTSDVYEPLPPVRKTRPIGGNKGGRRRKAAGGATDLPNEGLEALNQVAPNVVDKMGFQQGGMLTDQLSQRSIMNDPITQEVVLFILGESEDDESVNNFIEKYGSDAFMQLRNTVLESMTNQDVQTKGLITGTGQGGMADNIPMNMSGTPAAVSQGEFIVPADVVSMLGDGDTDSGGNELYAMMDRVRKTKTGTTKQAPELLNAGGLMPA